MAYGKSKSMSSKTKSTSTSGTLATSSTRTRSARRSKSTSSASSSITKGGRGTKSRSTSSKTSAITSKNITSARKDRATSKVGRRSTTRDSTTTSLNSGLAQLSALGSTPSIAASSSTTDLSEAYLATLGCVIDKGNTGFSLIATQTDTEAVSNENIFNETRFSTLTNTKTLATDKFVNSSDPFYELDDGLTQSKQLSISETIAATKADSTAISLSLISAMSK